MGGEWHGKAAGATGHRWWKPEARARTRGRALLKRVTRGVLSVPFLAKMAIIVVSKSSSILFVDV